MYILQRVKYFFLFFFLQKKKKKPFQYMNIPLEKMQIRFSHFDPRF